MTSYLSPLDKVFTLQSKDGSYVCVYEEIRKVVYFMIIIIISGAMVAIKFRGNCFKAVF